MGSCIVASLAAAILVQSDTHVRSAGCPIDASLQWPALTATRLLAERLRSRMVPTRHGRARRTDSFVLIHLVDEEGCRRCLESGGGQALPTCANARIKALDLVLRLLCRIVGVVWYLPHIGTRQGVLDDRIPRVPLCEPLFKSQGFLGHLLVRRCRRCRLRCVHVVVVVVIIADLASLGGIRVGAIRAA